MSSNPTPTTLTPTDHYIIQQDLIGVLGQAGLYNPTNPATSQIVTQVPLAIYEVGSDGVARAQNPSLAQIQSELTGEGVIINSQSRNQVIQIAYDTIVGNGVTLLNAFAWAIATPQFLTEVTGVDATANFLFGAVSNSSAIAPVPLFVQGNVAYLVVGTGQTGVGQQYNVTVQAVFSTQEQLDVALPPIVCIH